jgi:xanthine/uracil permease
VIVAIVLVFGIGFAAGGVNARIADVAISPLAIATLAGVILNVVLPKAQGGEREEECEDLDEKKGSDGESSPVENRSVEA